MGTAGASGATNTVQADTISDATAFLHSILFDAVNGEYTYTAITGRPTVDQVNQISVRLARLSVDGDPCARGLVPEFEIIVALCIDDDIRKGAESANASGPDIAEGMWRTWAGTVEIVNQFGRRRTADGLPACADVSFGDFVIGYEFNRAVGRGRISFALPTELTAIVVGS